jgi:hypothetical protein
MASESPNPEGRWGDGKEHWLKDLAKIYSNGKY